MPNAMLFDSNHIGKCFILFFLALCFQQGRNSEAIVCLINQIANCQIVMHEERNSKLLKALKRKEGDTLKRYRRPHITKPRDQILLPQGLIETETQEESFSIINSNHYNWSSRPKSIRRF
jgi:hypothetical protein